MNANLTMACGSRGDDCTAIYRHWEHEAAIIVGVLSNKIHSSRRPKDSDVSLAKTAAKLSQQCRGLYHRRLLVYPAGEEPAVDGYDLAGDKAGCVRCQEYGGACQFLNLAEPLHWSANEEFLAPFGSLEELSIQRSWKDPRSDGIHGDSARCQLDRELFG